MQEYFIEHIKPHMLPILAAGPADRLVIDLYHNPHHKVTKVIELNPYETSSAGHLYNLISDNQLLANGPLELRLHKTTPPLKEQPTITNDWKERLSKSDDVYGITEDQYQPGMTNVSITNG